MEQQTGLWLDHKRALFITNENGKETREEILSGLEGRVRIPGETKSYTRMGTSFFSHEKQQQNKKAELLKKYYHEIADKLVNATEIIIMGPAEAKDEFYKELLSYKKGTAIKVITKETLDSLTDNQIAARIREAFNYQKSR
jgi:ADP-heptose:LPS heptosyltransferase